MRSPSIGTSPPRASRQNTTLKPSNRCSTTILAYLHPHSHPPHCFNCSCIDSSQRRACHRLLVFPSSHTHHISLFLGCPNLRSSWAPESSLITASTHDEGRSEAASRPGSLHGPGWSPASTSTTHPQTKPAHQVAGCRAGQGGQGGNRASRQHPSASTTACQCCRSRSTGSSHHNH